MQVGNKFFLLIGFVVAFVVFSVFSLFFVLGVGYGVSISGVPYGFGWLIYLVMTISFYFGLYY